MAEGLPGSACLRMGARGVAGNSSAAVCRRRVDSGGDSLRIARCCGGTAVQRRLGTHRMCGLEVEGEHGYFVGASGVQPAFRAAARMPAWPRAATRATRPPQKGAQEIGMVSPDSGAAVGDAVCSVFFVWAYPGSEYTPGDFVRSVWNGRGEMVAPLFDDGENEE